MQCMDDNPRHPICPDCAGHGVTNQARASLVREPDGSSRVVQTIALAKCQACRGTGKAGA